MLSFLLQDLAAFVETLSPSTTIMPVLTDLTSALEILSTQVRNHSANFETFSISLVSSLNQTHSNLIHQLQAIYDKSSFSDYDRQNLQFTRDFTTAHLVQTNRIDESLTHLTAAINRFIHQTSGSAFTPADQPAPTPSASTPPSAPISVDMTLLKDISKGEKSTETETVATEAENIVTAAAQGEGSSAKGETKTEEPKKTDSDEQPISSVMGASKKKRVILEEQAFQEIEKEPLKLAAERPVKKLSAADKRKSKMTPEQEAAEVEQQRSLELELKEARAMNVSLEQFRELKEETMSALQQIETDARMAKKVATVKAKGTRVTAMRSQELTLAVISRETENEKAANKSSGKHFAALDLKKFEDVAARKNHPSKIVKVTVSKRRNSPWTLIFARANKIIEDSVVLDDLQRMGYSELLKIKDILITRKTEQCKKIVARIDELCNKVKSLGLIPLSAEQSPVPQLRAQVKRKRRPAPKEVDILKDSIESGDVPSANPSLNLRLPVGIHPIDEVYITKPER